MQSPKTAADSGGTAANSRIRVVAMGGGTGLSTLLKGLKRYVVSAADRVLPSNSPRGVVIDELSAVVTVTDDGGSSGRLRKEFNILPPGDIRNCIAALSEDERYFHGCSSTGSPPGRDWKGIASATFFLRL